MRNCLSKYITPNGLGGHLTSDFKSATLITLVSMCILSLMFMVASEAMAASKWPQTSYDLRFEISNLDYPGIYVHIASNSHFGDLWGHGGHQMASEVTFSVRFELIVLNVSMSLWPLTVTFHLIFPGEEGGQIWPIDFVSSTKVKSHKLPKLHSSSTLSIGYKSNLIRATYESSYFLGENKSQD